MCFPWIFRADETLARSLSAARRVRSAQDEINNASAPLPRRHLSPPPPATARPAEHIAGPRARTPPPAPERASRAPPFSSLSMRGARPAPANRPVKAYGPMT